MTALCSHFPLSHTQFLVYPKYQLVIRPVFILPLQRRRRKKKKTAEEEEEEDNL
jgi:hypothetical protein